MNIFDTILQKIGLEKPAAAKPLAVTAGVTVGPAPVTPAAPVAPVAPVAPPVEVAAVAAPIDQVAPAPAVEEVPAPPVALPMVDVISNLNALAASHPELDWKVSIVDLLKLLDMDSSFDARKNLAVELGCPENLMADSASMNIWLHKAVLQKIAENGGNIPELLLH